uniref:Uncharacterized protein n=1 Tax=Anguilla anguilla TaxID=7936 RepID=A0A0E9V1M8_ANGAN
MTAVLGSSGFHTPKKSLNIVMFR